MLLQSKWSAPHCVREYSGSEWLFISKHVWYNIFSAPVLLMGDPIVCPGDKLFSTVCRFFLAPSFIFWMIMLMNLMIHDMT
jgi:hypothetical protein